jgi:hypothetical protein
VYTKTVKKGRPLYISILNKWNGAIPAFKKKPKINKKSHNITKIVCVEPAAALEDEIIVFNSKYIEVFQINKESTKNRASNTELKKEIQNWVNNDITNLAGVGLTVEDL